MNVAVIEEEVITIKKFKAIGPDGKELKASTREELEKLYSQEQEKWEKIKRRENLNKKYPL